MATAVELWEVPQAKEVYMIAGWRQWADAGSISSRLPKYLLQQNNARQIGEMHPDDFYLFQIPGTHDLVRPTVNFEEGFPTALEVYRNEIYYTGDDDKGVVFFLGDEPHLNINRYVNDLLAMAQKLNVKRIVTFGGVYGELPYDRPRTVSAIYSLPHLKDEVAALAVNLSDYRGGASIGSYLCRLAGQQEVEHVGFYAFVPTYDFSTVAQAGSSIRLENDHMAWLDVMRRVNYMLKLDFDLSDLVTRSERLVAILDDKVEELDSKSPEIGVREYMAQLSAQYTEQSFEPLDDDVWSQALDLLFDEDE